MRRFIQDCKYPLDADRGGPLIINDLHIRRAVPIKNSRGKVTGYGTDPLSYIIGRVSAKGEGLLGHHVSNIGDNIPRTLFICDEASGMDDIAFKRAETWAARQLWIGNCYSCNNSFYYAIKGNPSTGDPGGDILAKELPPAPAQKR